MELYEEILINELMRKFSGQFDVSSIINDVCYQTLQKIKAIIEDDSLEDSECFMKIEEIVQVFEHLGSNGGGRHDFG